MSFKLKGGRLKTGQAAKDAFEKELRFGDVSKIVLRVVKKPTPVVTGRLIASWRVQQGPTWKANTLQIRLENKAPYAARVNRKGRSAGYADRGIAAAKAEVLKQLKLNIEHVGKALWDGKA